MRKIEASVSEHKEIKKMPTRKKVAIESLSPEQVNKIEGLIDAIGSAGLDEFMEYIHSPWKMLWPNFVAGIARGFGALVGVAFVLAGIGWIFAITVDLPLIGKRLEPYVDLVQNKLNHYIEQTNYSDEFKSLDSTLRNLDTTMKAIEKNTTPKN